MTDSTSYKSENIAFDFEQWSALAESDPDAFEVRRSQLLEEAIRRAPPAKRQRLRRLQWKLDQVRNTAGTSMAACVRMSRMMWDSTLGEGGLLDALDRLARPEVVHPPRPVAKVLPFRSRH